MMKLLLRRNTEAFEKCDLIPSVLTDVSNVNLSTTVLGQKIKFPFFLSPTAMHQMYHPDGEVATAKAAEKLELFLVYLRWQLQVSKMFLKFLMVPKCSNCIFIKIKA